MGCYSRGNHARKVQPTHITLCSKVSQIVFFFAFLSCSCSHSKKGIKERENGKHTSVRLGGPASTEVHNKGRTLFSPSGEEILFLFSSLPSREECSLIYIPTLHAALPTSFRHKRTKGVNRGNEKFRLTSFRESEVSKKKRRGGSRVNAALGVPPPPGAAEFINSPQGIRMNTQHTWSAVNVLSLSIREEEYDQVFLYVYRTIPPAAWNGRCYGQPWSSTSTNRSSYDDRPNSSSGKSGLLFCVCVFLIDFHIDVIELEFEIGIRWKFKRFSFCHLGILFCKKKKIIILPFLGIVGRRRRNGDRVV